MLAATLHKEWLEIKRSGQSIWIMSITLLLLCAALVTSWADFHTQNLQKQTVAESERQRWVNQGEKGPHSAAHYGVYVLKPDNPLAILDPGLNDFQGTVLRLEAHKRNDSLFRKIQDEIPMQRFGKLTPAFVLQIIFPLLIILVGHHLVALEREQGTLKQLLMSGYSPVKLLYAKTAALFLCASIALLPVIGFVFYSWLNFDSFDVGRSSALVLGYILYFLIWSVATVSISALMPLARLAIISLLVLWGFTCLLVPKLAMTGAVNQYPIESTRAFQSKLESEVYTAERQQAIAAFKQTTLREYAVEKSEDLPFDWAGAELQFGEQYANKIFDRLYHQRSKQWLRQTGFYQFASIFSPFVALQSLSMASAATDLSHHLLFSDAAEQHRRLMQATLNNNLRDHGHTVKGNYVADESLWQQIPQFTFDYPSITKITSTYVKPLAFLFGWLVIVGVGWWLCAKLMLKEKSQ